MNVRIIIFISFLGSLAWALPKSQDLEQAVLENAPDVKLAEQTYRQKSAASYEAVTRWLPRLDAQLSDNKSSVNPITGFLLPGQEFKYKESVLVVSFPIYHRAVHLLVEQSFDEKEIARNQYEIARSEARWKIHSLIGDYYLSLYRQASIEKALKAAQDNQHETEIRFNLGGRSKIDVLKTQSNLSALESQKLANQTEVEAAFNALKEYSGLSEDSLQSYGFPVKERSESWLEQEIQNFNISASDQKILNEILKWSEDRLDQEIANKSPNYFVLASQEELGLAQARQIFASEWPSLDFKATFSQVGETWTDTYNSGTESRFFGITLTIPLFSFGGGIANWKASSAAQLANQTRLEKEKIALRDRIHEQLIQTRSLLQLTTSQEIRKNQNVELERLTQKSYELGKSSSTDLLLAQNDALQAKFDFAKARLDLYRATHQLLLNFGYYKESLQ